MAAPTSKGGATPDTIFALSSGAVPSAIAVMRISGAAALETLEAMTGSRPVARRASLRTVRALDGDILDHALALFFPGPSTATGEDLAELHLHGGRAVVDATMRDLTARGLRPAEPGEFTRRALFHGRMDLTAVEGLADLLAAETEAQRREALLRSEGTLGRRLDDWSRRLVAIAAILEAVIDYDGDAEVAHQDVIARAQMAGLLADIGTTLDVPPAERLRDGIRVVISGPPNAGKSTLFNAIVGHDAAIVSPIAGTTRDSVERPVAFGGMPFVMIDTAGIRETSDPIESIGVERARLEAGRADIVIDLDGALHKAATITVSAKADIVTPPAGSLAISARTGDGMAQLIERIIDTGRTLLPRPGDVSIDRRYRLELTEAQEALDLAKAQDDMLIAAEHIRRARQAMDRLTGNAGIDDMLDALFGRFCLGK